MPTNAAYRARFETLSGWDADWVANLFAVPPQTARNVSEMTDRIMKILT